MMPSTTFGRNWRKNSSLSRWYARCSCFTFAPQSLSLSVCLWAYWQLHRHALARYQRQHHVPWWHCDCHRRDGGWGYRYDRERAQAHRENTTYRQKPLASHRQSGRRGGGTVVFLIAHHHAQLCPCFCPSRARG